MIVDIRSVIKAAEQPTVPPVGRSRQPVLVSLDGLPVRACAGTVASSPSLARMGAVVLLLEVIDGG
jgi:hypothetical protein